MNRRILAAVAAVAALAAGCSTDDADAEAPGASETDAPTSSVEIVGVDYGFEGVPSTVAAGTELTFRNGSAAEVHEMVVMRIADGEERPITELLTLPEEEAMAVTSMVGVSVALPEEEGTVVDGELTLAEPGRYALLCFIPVGADPAVVEEAMQAGAEDGPPEMGDGAPHFTEGMVAELTVEG